MKIIKNLFFHTISTSILIFFIGCSSSSDNKKVDALLDAQAQLEKDLSMYENTWSRFLNGDTTVINESRFHDDVVVVTANI